MEDVLRHLLRQIDEAYDRQSFHGTNLRGSIRGLTARQASWRPAQGRHNIWEVTVHAAYWKYVVRRRLLGEKRGSFPTRGSNWFARQGGSQEAWEEDVALLAAMHHTMRKAIAELPVAQLERKAAGSKVPNDYLIRGIAAHDLYHAGQIQLLKRLQRRG